MCALLRGLMQTVLPVRAKVVLQERRSNISSKPPKDKIGPGQTLFAMAMFAISLLVPAGWIMHHIPEYRKRPCPPSDGPPRNSIM
ncbi:hypothetical protein MATL_G00163400 [Megalops atlanticus]|uniref:Uncharacterized protein n=1 Tax=Megalops atlanticus TaxID=7932 RepID=A0A9D3PQZ4_MEGAT|nr:hypothetical protein MATL_G00163400 [Megalops atlanticus]